MNQRGTKVLALTAASGLAVAAAFAGDGDRACMEARGLMGYGGVVKPAKVAGYDEGTGKDLRNYPPHRQADLIDMRLEVVIPDMNVPRMEVVQRLRLAALGMPLEQLTLDAKGEKIGGVAMEGRQVTYAHDGRVLSVTFSPPLMVGEEVTLITKYTVDDPPLGLVWTPESAAWPGRAAQLHTQGEPETNSYWFPCRDFPNEKFTSELVVTVPAGYLVSGNGSLKSRVKDIRAVDTAGGTRRMAPCETFDWVQEKPHSPYLVSLVAGKFDIVDVGTKALAMPVWVPPGKGPWVEGTFGRTSEMVAHFEMVTGQKYPWARYAQVGVYNFGSGGMENTSATTLYDTVAIEPGARDDHDAEGLISHELAHQWFGDLCTCNSWEHIWLNEGFATYMTDLWFEKRDGQERYAAEVLGQFDGVIANDKVDAPAQVGMCSKVYNEAWEVFRKPANPYGKGASILHMLRRELGDEDFFEGIRLYVQRRKYQTAETSDLRTAMEEVSGRSLEQFFYQWCVRPGVPRLKVTKAWDAAEKKLTVTVEQTQKIDGDNPAFEFPLMVAADVEEGGQPAFEVLRMNVAGKATTASIPCAAEPAALIVDPRMAVLAKVEVEQDEAAWRLLAAAPTSSLYTRVQACRAIGAGSGGVSPGTADTLRRIALDTGAAVLVRQEAVRALGKRGAVADVRSLAMEAIGAWEVRAAVCEALGEGMDKEGADRAGAADVLARKARGDSSTRVRVAAIKALAGMKAENGAAVALEGLKMESHSDEVRQASIEALGTLGAADGLTQVMAYTAPGRDTRTRPTAAAAVGKLASQDEALAVRTLAALLGDRELRTRRGAGEALADLKTPLAVAALEKARDGARDEEERRQLGVWVERAGGK